MAKICPFKLFVKMHLCIHLMIFQVSCGHCCDNAWFSLNTKTCSSSSYCGEGFLLTMMSENKEYSS